jgi:hypothetical protein
MVVRGKRSQMGWGPYDPRPPSHDHDPSRHPIELPFDAPDENCMIHPLSSRAQEGVAGTVEYAQAWLDH